MLPMSLPRTHPHRHHFAVPQQKLLEFLLSLTSASLHFSITAQHLYFEAHWSASIPCHDPHQPLDHGWLYPCSDLLVLCLSLAVVLSIAQPQPKYSKLHLFVSSKSRHFLAGFSVFSMNHLMHGLYII
ncbi:hypothetical protein L1987_47200 [Smallanthus sonchifolius]|uniref:Uncharacterized protein n=1 Tax=Smallanthus sonchifolius TaxID=185202 RepID=A0ACB9G2W2_9ASTR|nr:hypothetical protein L1987_47200 [Smallanthus sonchifolius]